MAIHTPQTMQSKLNVVIISLANLNSDWNISIDQFFFLNPWVFSIFNMNVWHCIDECLMINFFRHKYAFLWLFCINFRWIMMCNAASVNKCEYHVIRINLAFALKIDTNADNRMWVFVFAFAFCFVWYATQSNIHTCTQSYIYYK